MMLNVFYHCVDMSQLATAKFQKQRYWIFVLVLIGYPCVAAVVEILGVDSRTITVPYRGLIAAASVGVLTIAALSRPRFKLSLFWLAWAGFWTLYAARILLDSLFNPPAMALAPSEYWMYSIGVSMLPATAIAILGERATGLRSFQKIGYLGLLGLVSTLWVLINYDPAFSLSNLAVLRAETDTLNPIALGHLAVTCIIISICAAFGKRESPAKFLFFYTPLLLISFFVLFISSSRGPALSLLTVGFICGIRSGLSFKFAIGLGLAAIFFFVLLNPELLHSFFVDRLLNDMWKDSTRIQLLTNSFKLIIENPMLGAGIEPMETYPHNLIVESFLAGGIPMGILFLTMLIISTWRAVSISNIRQSESWVGLLHIQYAVAAMVSGSLYFAGPFWLLMAAVVSITPRKHR